MQASCIKEKKEWQGVALSAILSFLFVLFLDKKGSGTIEAEVQAGRNGDAKKRRNSIKHLERFNPAAEQAQSARSTVASRAGA
nr:hypothetical protein [Planococcus glaciei]